ncbi:hypothetical protein GCM10022226_06970 [Sphaerisporangium flaviroseum]|uniref:DUF998 domain-containing protein n=2 Tax=Sphaerisporangium flaviroseum TaxID=509199 RepID=A0ABP7HF50_9ACTN
MLVASITMAVGRIGVPLDALHLTIGQSAALERGGSTEFAMALLALSSLGLLAGLRAVRAPVSGWPERLMLTWVVSLTVAAVSPVTAVIDVMIAIALASLAGTAALMVRRFGDDELWRPVGRPLEWLALGAGGGLAVLTYVAFPGHRVMIGLAEWALLGIEVAALAVVAVQLVRITLSSAVSPAATAVTPPVVTAPVTAAPSVTPFPLRAWVPSARTPVRSPAMSASVSMAMTLETATTGAGRSTGVLSRH